MMSKYNRGSQLLQFIGIVAGNAESNYGTAEEVRHEYVLKFLVELERVLFIDDKITFVNKQKKARKMQNLFGLKNEAAKKEEAKDAPQLDDETANLLTQMLSEKLRKENAVDVMPYVNHALHLALVADKPSDLASYEEAARSHLEKLLDERARRIKHTIEHPEEMCQLLIDTVTGIDFEGREVSVEEQDAKCKELLKKAKAIIDELDVLHEFKKED